MIENVFVEVGLDNIWFKYLVFYGDIVYVYLCVFEKWDSD